MPERKSEKAILALRCMVATRITNELAMSILLCKPKTKKSGLKSWPKWILLDKLLAQKKIRPIPGEKGKMNHTATRFYQPMPSIYKKYGVTQRIKRAKNPNDPEHEQMLLDVLTVIFRSYHADYEINVTRPSFKHPDEPYKPDAHIKLISKNNPAKSRDILLEVETGSRSPETIAKAKLDKMAKLNFGINGLHKKTSFLMVYACDDEIKDKGWNKYWRPIEYQEHPELIQKNHDNLNRIMKLRPNLPNNFLFMTIDKLPRLIEHPDRAIVTDIKGNAKSILNN